jgi:hypothetical protein
MRLRGEGEARMQINVEKPRASSKEGTPTFCFFSFLAVLVAKGWIWL